MQENRHLRYIWENRALYIGRFGELAPHRFTSPILCACLEGDVNITVDDKTHTPKEVFVFPSNYQHASHYDNKLIAVIFLDPVSSYYLRIKKNTSLNEHGYYDGFNNQGALIEAMQRIDQHRPAIDDVFTEVSPVLDLLVSPKAPTIQVDERLLKVAKEMRKDPTKKLSVSNLADKIHVSEAYLMELFKKEVGISTGQYYEWLKLFQVAIDMYQEDNISHAAVKAGFADVAHMSRVYKAAFGLTPSDVCKLPIETYICSNIKTQY